MDTTAYLTRQGWRGAGHSLHPTGRGIQKPLLVSQKSNVLGIGKKKHDAHADQWWARAFDSSLKGLDVGKVGEEMVEGGNIVVLGGFVEGDVNEGGVTVKSREWSQLDMMRAGGGKWVGNGGLYGGFVKGQGLTGTIGNKSARTSSPEPSIVKGDGSKDPKSIVNGYMESSRSKKRKRDDADGKEERRKQRRQRKEAKSHAQLAQSARDKSSATPMGITKPESKEERRRRRAEHKAANADQIEETAISGLDRTNSLTILRSKKKRKKRRCDESGTTDNTEEVTEESSPVGGKGSPVRSPSSTESLEMAAKRHRKEARRANKADKADRAVSSTSTKLIDSGRRR